MSDNEIYPKWVATGVGGHRYNTLDEYLYTSDAPPVEYDEYVRTLQRAEAAEAERDQLLRHLADADQSSMERIAQIDALEAALAAVPTGAISTVICAAEPHLSDPRHRVALDTIRRWAVQQPEVQP